MSAQFKTLVSYSMSIASGLGLILANSYSAIAETIKITSYGHSALLIEGGGKSILLNPFKSVGCASGLLEPRIKADIILASSQLADEGALHLLQQQIKYL